ARRSSLRCTALSKCSSRMSSCAHTQARSLIVCVAVCVDGSVVWLCCGCATDIDIVYIGTVQHLHLQHAMLALQNNKQVLVEKPVGCTGAEAETLIHEVLQHNV